MSFRDIYQLLRRQLIVSVALCLVGAGVAYHLLHLNPGYKEKAVLAFVSPDNKLTVGGLFDNGNGLLATQELSAFYMQSAQGKAAVSAAGGTAHYSVDLVNLSSQEFPWYGVPYVTVTVDSSSPVVTAATYAAVTRVLNENLKFQQLKAGAPAGTFITTIPASHPTGPIIQTGSHLRVLAATVLLTLILTVLMVSFVDRHRILRLNNIT